MGRRVVFCNYLVYPPREEDYQRVELTRPTGFSYCEFHSRTDGFSDPDRYYRVHPHLFALPEWEIPDELECLAGAVNALWRRARLQAQFKSHLEKDTP